jgi:hypothetical protein
MERKLGTFMFYIRLLELLAWLAIVVENGWLTDYIIQRRLGFANNMAAVECIVRQHFSTCGISMSSLTERRDRLDLGLFILFFKSSFFTITISHHAPFT